MDYDDNDFQSQNLHLAGAGEGSTKFPPVLRPYSLPKFDYDESLQGHLRFDSLVDTEVFLGIESNEDNQWIDAYSRVSSGIEFNSTEAETCSISRHNNVWSEATSSESVEMLLKSVGQEEFTPREGVIQESDACDELACLVNQMDPYLKADEKIEFKDDVADTQPPSCIHEKLSGTKEDVEMEQSLAGVSQGREGEPSIDGSLNNMEPPYMRRHIYLPESGGFLFTDGKYDDTIQMNETPADASLNEKTNDNSSASVATTNMTEASTENIPSTCEVLKIQNMQNQVVATGDDNQSSLETPTSKQDLESYVKNENSDVDTQTLDVSAVEGESNQSDNPLCLIHRQGTLEGESVVEGLATGISTSEKSLNTVSNDISNLQKTERGSEDACFRDLSQRNANTDTLLIKDPVAGDQSAPNTSNIAIKNDSSSEGEDACFEDLSQGNANKDALLVKGPLTDDQSPLSTSDTPMIAVEDDSSSEGHRVEVSSSDCGTRPNYHLNMVTIEKTLGESNVSKEKELLNIGDQMDTDDLLSKEEASMFAVVDKKTLVVSEGNIDNKASFFSFNTVVSTKSRILAETTPVCENNKSNKQGDHNFFCQAISVSDQVIENTPFDLSTIQRDVDQSHLADGGVCSSSLGACSMETSTVPVDVTPINSSDVRELKRMKHVNSASVDEKENFEAQIVEEAGIALPVGFSELEVDPCHVARNEIKKNSDNTGHILWETDNNSLHNLDNSATESIGEPQEIQSGMVDHKCTQESSVVAVLCESVEKQGDEVTDSFIKADREAIEEHRDKPYSKLSGSISPSIPDPHNELHETGGCPANPSYYKCGPSATFGSPLETEKGVNIKPTANLNTPVFEFVNEDARNTSSSDHDHKGYDVSKDGKSLAPDVDLVAHSSKKDVTDSTPIGSKAGERGPLKTEKGLIIKPIDNLNTPVFEFINKDARNTSSSDHDHKGNDVSKDARSVAPDVGVVANSPKKDDTDLTPIGAKAGDTPVFEFINKDARNTSSSDHDHKGNDVSKDGRSVAPEVGVVANSPKKDDTDLTPIGAKAGVRDPFPDIAANKESVVVAESPLASELGTPKPNVARFVSHGSPQTPDGDLAQSVSKGTPERKTRRTPIKTAGKESSRKGSKGKTPAKRSEKGDRSTSVPLSPSSGFQLMQSNEAHQYRKIDSISTKPFSDLNTSASPSVVFQQPFMDVQQVQLRAQILVYGALIQGIVPEEAYMLSAFGGADGGRNFWEKAWSSCLERQRSHKSHPVNPETPPQSLSGIRTHDSAVKQSEPQGKGISSPLGLASSKGTPTIVNPFIPLSSPLWSLPSPSQALVSLHHNQTPPLRNFLGHNTSRISQSPHRGPWVASTPTLDNSSYLSASPVTDTIKSSSIKETSVPSSSSIKNVSPNLQAFNVGLQNVFLQTTPLFNTSNATVSSARHSCDSKSKKRKKVTTDSEDLGHKAMHLQSHLVSTPVVSNHISPANATATPVVNVPVTTVEKSVESVSPLSLADRLKNGWNVEKRIMSDESLTKIEEARINAEEASAHSAAAVNHSMEIWKQLDKHKNSGLASVIEAKLASAAVAVAAAAAVAKAAAAAANVASNAALQAKLMADEALMFSGHESSCGTYFSEGMSNLGKATPASILKGASGINSSSSIIGAAKEASRRRVEAASFARKRVENVDAIVKAAELAAEAVSQAGRIVTMGDPLPLSELVEAGPEGYWKTFQESSQQVGLLKGMGRCPMNVDNVDRPEASQISNRDTSSMEMEKQIAASEESPFQKVHKETSLDHIRSVDENSSNGSRGRKVSNLVNPIDVLPESVTEIQASLTDGNGYENLENNIKEGSHVEVFKDGKGFKAAWFTANLLSLKDGKAYVCYNRLVADEGAGPLKEWVSLEDEGDKPPRIRAAHTLISLHNEGTRKRQRAAMVDYWSIGDKVDAWIQESWQEGIVTERNKKDKTYTVQFPASGETSVVEAWYLRPSLIWNDGKWVESPNAGANDSPTKEGDAPREKRTKLCSPTQELVKRKDKTSKGTYASESANPSELRLLNLNEDHKVFNVGRNIKNEKNSDAHRLARSGLQKEGPKVIFGVPKQGRKKKFMEVSKHYVEGGTSRINDGNDSDKIVDSLIPHTSGSRGWKNSSIKDTKEKLGADCKPISKSGKPQVLGRVIPSKQKPLSNSRNNDLTSRTERTRDSSSHANNASQRENQMERASYSETPGARQTSNSSRASSTDSPPTKKPPTSRVSKGKQTAAVGRWGKVEVEKAVKGNPVKSTSEEVLEPRRSNRKIQPTSRLLEGIQSSLIIAKTPGPHEKGYKNQNRNTPRGNNHG